MEKKWEDLSSDERQEELFQRWLSPPGIEFASPEAEKLYKERATRIKDAGLRDKVKVMIGGGQISEEIRKYAGADAYGKDAMAGVSLAKKWVGAK